MEDLLKCFSRAEPSRAEPSRAEPSRAEPSRAEPSRAEPSYSFALLYEYVGCFALLEDGRCFWLRQKSASLGFFVLWSVVLALPLCL